MLYSLVKPVNKGMDLLPTKELQSQIQFLVMTKKRFAYIKTTIKKIVYDMNSVNVKNVQTVTI